MAKILDKSSIVSLGVVRPWHVSQSVDAFTGIEAYNITISGSLTVTGSTQFNIGTNVFLISSGSAPFLKVDSQGKTTISGSASDLFLIKNAIGTSVLAISQSGLVTLSTQSMTLTNPAPNGAIYFTSGALYVGLD
jgi:hypothetical protein